MRTADRRSRARAALRRAPAAARGAGGQRLIYATARPSAPATLRARPCSAAKLKAVKADKADVDALAHEFDLPKAVAERQLRLAGGDVHAAFRSLMGLQQEPAVR